MCNVRLDEYLKRLFTKSNIEIVSSFKRTGPACFAKYNKTVRGLRTSQEFNCERSTWRKIGLHASLVTIDVWVRKETLTSVCIRDAGRFYI